MQSRNMFLTKDSDRSPPVGAYNPRYDIILPRIPGHTIKKKLKRKRKVNTHTESMIQGSISMPNFSQTVKDSKPNKKSIL